MKDIMEMGDIGQWGGGFNDGGVSCDVCRNTSERRPARLHCSQCAVFYCERCIRKHSANARFLKHDVTKLTSSKGSMEASRNLSFCQKHIGHRVQFVCITCRPYAALCPICFLDHDVTHDVSEVKDVADNFRNQFRADLNAIKTKIHTFKEQKADATERRAALEQMLQDVQEAICWQTLLVIAQVEDAKLKMTTEAQDMFAALWTSFSEDEVDSHLKELKDVKSDLENIVGGTDEACLAFHENLGLTERVEKLQSVVMLNESFNKDIQFVPNKENIDQDILGTLEYFFISDFKDDNSERRSSIVKTERLEMVTAMPEMANRRITIPQRCAEKTDEKEGDKKWGCEGKCRSQCELCQKKSVLISFYSTRLDRLQKLCRHCRALTDTKSD